MHRWLLYAGSIGRLEADYQNDFYSMVSSVVIAPLPHDSAGDCSSPPNRDETITTCSTMIGCNRFTWADSMYEAEQNILAVVKR